MSMVRSRNAAKAPEVQEKVPTKIMRDKVGSCQSMTEYEELVKKHSHLYVDWANHVKPLLKEKRLTAQKLADGCGVHKNTASKFNKTIPANRDNVIMMAMMLQMTVDEANVLLTRWARYPGLYAKTPEDATWIYLLDKGGSSQPKALFLEYWKVYEEELARYHNEPQPKGYRPLRGTLIMRQEIDTYAKNSLTAEAQKDTAYREMIRSHLPEYDRAHKKLMKFLDERLSLAMSTEGSAHQMFADNAYFHDFYYEKMRNLREQHALPSRTFLIVLGLRLNMDPLEIDKMLSLACMAPLCAKDRLESAMVFRLEELYCECPNVFSRFRVVDSDTEIVVTHSNPEFEDEKVNEYMSRKMEESCIDLSQEEKKRAEEFLKML